jgi:YbbR domain-containing protein
MIRGLRENILLKLIALATALMIWTYARLERSGAPARQVVAEVVTVGVAAPGLSVDVKPTMVNVDVAGPAAQLDSIPDGAVKAIVDLGAARAGMKALPVTRFAAPPEAPAITFPVQTRSVAVEVRVAARRRMQIGAEYRNDPPFGKRYATPRIEPAWADVEGPRDAVQRVAALLVRLSPSGKDLREQATIAAVDRAGLAVEEVRIEPPAAYVEVDLQDVAASRSLIVNPVLRGSVDPQFTVTSVVCEPNQVTVAGSPSDLLGLGSIATMPVSLDGLRADTTREVPLDVPRGVTVREGRAMVSVTIRVTEVARTAPAP